MPVTPTYPGVYIEEVPSGVRTITGVATSITAFIGRACAGPSTNQSPSAASATSSACSAGSGPTSMMSYAVRDFYLNGGSQALIVRIHNGAAQRRRSPCPPLALRPPTNWSSRRPAWHWGGNCGPGEPPNAAMPTTPNPDPNLFNLIVFERSRGGPSNDS